MKKIYKIMALLLVAAMLLCICACGKATSAKKEKNSIVGSWKYECDVTDILVEMIGSQSGAELKPTEKFIITIGLDLNKDSSCKLCVDKETSTASFESFLPSFIDSLTDAMYQMGEGQGLSREDFDEVFKTQYGCDVHSYIEDNIAASLDIDSLFADLSDLEGFYKVENDKLVVSEDKDDFSEASECEFELKGDKLSIKSISDNAYDVEDFLDEFELDFPIEFTR